MDVATNSVGVRELKNGLSGYLARVKDGEELVVTDRGRPVARLVPMSHSSDRIMELIAAGQVRPARKRLRKLPERVKAKGTVSDLVPEQRG